MLAQIHYVNWMCEPTLSERAAATPEEGPYAEIVCDSQRVSEPGGRSSTASISPYQKNKKSEHSNYTFCYVLLFCIFIVGVVFLVVDRFVLSNNVL